MSSCPGEAACPKTECRAAGCLQERARAAYRRPTLVEVLIYHQATSTSGCHCGWNELGRSHAEHVADVYEQSVMQT